MVIYPDNCVFHEIRMIDQKRPWEGSLFLFASVKCQCD